MKLFKRKPSITKLKNYKEILNFGTSIRTNSISFNISSKEKFDRCSVPSKFIINCRMIDDCIKHNHRYMLNDAGISLTYEPSDDKHIYVFGMIGTEYVVIKCDSDFNPKLKAVLIKKPDVYIPHINVTECVFISGLKLSYTQLYDKYEAGALIVAVGGGSHGNTFPNVNAITEFGGQLANNIRFIGYNIKNSCITFNVCEGKSDNILYTVSLYEKESEDYGDE